MDNYSNWSLGERPELEQIVLSGGSWAIDKWDYLRKMGAYSQGESMLYRITTDEGQLSLRRDWGIIWQEK